jgi:hypothetical protein
MSNRSGRRLDRSSTRKIGEVGSVSEMEASTNAAVQGAVHASGASPNATATTSAAAGAGKTTAGATGASSHASGTTTVSGALKGAGVAVKASLLAKSLAVVGLGVAGLVVAAHVGSIGAAQGTLSLVPSWSSGPSLLGSLHAGLSGSGSGGAGLNLGL